jgi:predicted lipoprotein with Yx(FWY)xxD motif
MRRSVLAVVAVVALVAAGVAVASSLGATKRPTVKAVGTPGFGKVLVTSSGRTLYHYTDEKRRTIECTGACARFWPPLLVKRTQKLVAGPGIKASKLGTIKRPGGARQVTYNGFALYRYAPDRKAGDVNGQGVDGEWYVIASSGKLIRKAAPAETTPPPPPTETTPPPPTETTPPPPPYDYG